MRKICEKLSFIGFCIWYVGYSAYYINWRMFVVLKNVAEKLLVQMYDCMFIVTNIAFLLVIIMYIRHIRGIVNEKKEKSAA